MFIQPPAENFLPLIDGELDVYSKRLLKLFSELFE